MTIPSAAIVSGPYTPNGVLREWDFDFKITADDQIVIILVDGEGVETEVTSGFTVPSADIGSANGGTITYPVAPNDPLEFANYEEVYLLRRVTLGQPNQIGNQGGFYPETHENTFDLLAMQIQQVNEIVGRSVVVPVSAGAGDLTGLIADVLLLADLEAEISAIAGITADVTTVAGLAAEIAALGPISANITTVAGISGNVTTVAGISANVATVAGVSADVTTVAGLAAEIAALGPISANITAVAGISGNVTTVAGISGDVTTVAGVSANVTTVATNIADIQAAVADLPSLAAKANLTSVVRHDTVQTFTTDEQGQARANIGGANPAGEVALFAMNTAPSGWLKANGAAVSRTTYAALFTAIGTTFGAGDGSTTFELPDLRGEFVRGWDDSRGVDSGRTFGSWQDHEIDTHSHYIANSTSTAISSSGSGHAGGNLNNDAGGGRNSDATGGDETRPRNVALLACIKF